MLDTMRNETGISNRLFKPKKKNKMSLSPQRSETHRQTSPPIDIQREPDRASPVFHEKYLFPTPVFGSTSESVSTSFNVFVTNKKPDFLSYSPRKNQPMIVDPLQWPEIKQVQGRAVRLSSHETLPVKEEERKVDVTIRYERNDSDSDKPLFTTFKPYHYVPKEPASIYTVDTHRTQQSYDDYNNFIFGSNDPIFFKMATRMDIFNKVRNLNGDIVECGVFKGSGMMLWLKLLKMYSPHDSRKVIGFDFFGKDFVETLTGSDHDGMKEVFDRCQAENNDLSTETLSKKFVAAGASPDRFQLVKGDISKTIPEFLSTRPGMRVSVLYLDVDTEEPTYNALVALWDRVVPGGIVVFDEYGYHVWSESNAVDRFVKEKNLTLHKFNVPSPTAFLVKGT